jgi:hypothetical protein
MKEITRREDVDDSYVSRMVNLTTLALDIVASVLDETLIQGDRDDPHLPRCVSCRAGSSPVATVPGAAPAGAVRLKGITQRRPPWAVTSAAWPWWRMARG